MIPIDEVIKQQEILYNIITILGLFVLGLSCVAIGHYIKADIGRYISLGGGLLICIVVLAWLSTLIIPIPLWLGFIVSVIFTMILYILAAVLEYKEIEKDITYESNKR